MLACAYDDVGGRDLDFLLATHFAEEFKTKYKVSYKMISFQLSGCFYWRIALCHIVIHVFIKRSARAKIDHNNNNNSNAICPVLHINEAGSIFSCISYH